MHSGQKNRRIEMREVTVKKTFRALRNIRHLLLRMPKAHSHNGVLGTGDN